MKYPIGIQTFEKIISEDYVYVDKTDMVYSLAHRGSIYFLSRPRRFGKSLFLSTLENYFLGKKELFKGLFIEKLEKEWKTYPVFHVDFNSENYTEPNTLNNAIDNYLCSWENKYGLVSTSNQSSGRRFANVLEAAHKQTGTRCVVLVDEYDKPILDVMDSGMFTLVGDNKMSIEDKNRETLKAFYSTFKLADKDLHFVFLTGVTKFSQVSIFSGFNQPNDISMDERYDTICGMTDEEIDRYFAQTVVELAEKRMMSVSESRLALKKRFDGYHFSCRLKGVYNPFSLLNTFNKLTIDDYWFSTGTPTYLIRLLNHFGENLNDLTNKYYFKSQFYEFNAVGTQSLPIIYQSGYLTIKTYDPENEVYTLDFPNEEVERGFVSLVASNYFKDENELASTITYLNMALKNADLEEFRKVLTAFLSSIPYEMRRKKLEQEKERYFHYTFYLIFRLISTYLVYTEKRQSQGRVDCVVETKRQIYIFEFKLDGSAQEALRQIQEKGYAREYANDARKIYKVGCSFSSKTGTIEDWAVEG